MNENVWKPLDRLAAELAGDMSDVNALIRERMASRHVPRIPEVTAHLVEAGGNACARSWFWRRRGCAATRATSICCWRRRSNSSSTATLLHDDVVDESQQRRGRLDGEFALGQQVQRAGRRRIFSPAASS